MTNLEILKEKAEKLGLDMHERNYFDDYLIGALSAIVSPEDWAIAIKSAENCLLRLRGSKAVRS